LHNEGVTQAEATKTILIYYSLEFVRMINDKELPITNVTYNPMIDEFISISDKWNW